MYPHLLKSFPQFVVIHKVKGFSVVSEAEVDVFLEFSSFFYDPIDVGNFISGSSAFSKSSLYIWRFSVHILLKPSLKDFEHYLAGTWNECRPPGSSIHGILKARILECEVKWTLGSIATNKANRGDGIPTELLQILKDDAVKVLNSICQQIWKTAMATWLEKVSFHSIPKKGNAKECSNYCTVVLISCASKIMFKILQARLQQYMN